MFSGAAFSIQRPVSLECWTLRAKRAFPDFIHKLRIAMKELKESRVWLLFASRIRPCEQVVALRDEARQLVLMLGKSINTAVARSRDNQI